MPDALVGAFQPTLNPANGSGTIQQGPGYVRLISGADGRTIHTLVGRVTGAGYAASFGFLGDVDNDGTLDAWVAAPLAGSRIEVARLDARPLQPIALCGSNGAPLSIGGSTSLAANDLVLSADVTLPALVGVFFYARQRWADKPLLFGAGILCLEAPLFRIASATSDPAGVASLAVDYTRHPLSAGAGRIDPGSTWSFQYWFRRSPIAFDFSDAVTIPFVP